MDSENTINCVEPVYFKNSDVPVEKDNWLSNWEVCMASEYVINPDKKGQYTEAAQKIGDLWRIYLNDETARVNLLMQGIILRGMHIEVKDKNPFVTPGFESFQTTRLFIRNIPLSFDNNTIANAIRNKGAEMVNALKYSRARDPSGKLTNFKTGARFVDIVIPENPLPKKLKIGDFTASLYHKEQKQSLENKECGNCMQKGHIRKECPNEMVCYECRQPGHKKGDPECPSLKEQFQDGDDYLSTTSELKNNDEVEEDETESESDTDQNKTVNQVIKNTITDHEQVTPKPVSQKIDKQTLMTAFVESNLQPAKSGSRPASPAGRRKLADRSPEDSLLQKGKKTKQDGKNK